MKKHLLFLIWGAAGLSARAQTPDLVFANGMGAANQDYSGELVLDNAGNSYLVGTFNNTVDFDPSAGVANLTASGADIFVAKYTADGDYVWAFSVGGGGNDYGVTITLDTDNNIYIGGSFVNTADFDPGIGNAPLYSGTYGDGFIAKYDANGNYQWAICMEGAGYSGVDDMVLDNTGNICVGGHFTQTADFNPSTGIANLTAASGYHDLFIAKYTSAGIYAGAYAISGNGSKTMSSIDTDDSGNIFIGGYFTQTADFNPGAGVANLTAGMWAADIFMAKYNSSGTYVWAKSIGLALLEDMVVDPSGTFYITGYIGGSTVDFDPGVGVANLSGSPGSAAFVGKYTTDGNYEWAFGLGTSGAGSRGRAIGIDAVGNVYIAGDFYGNMDADPSAGTTILAGNPNMDVFFASYTSTGVLNWAEKIGGALYEMPRTLALDNNGSIWLSGYFSETVDFDPNLSNTYELTSAGNDDVFLARYQYCTVPALSETLHQDISCNGGSDGNATIDVSGSAPFNFSWTPNVSSNETLSGVEAGTYECLVTSTCGTENTITVTITEPTEITTSLIAQNNATCFGGTDGSVEIDATGGTGSLDFEWQPGNLPGPSINGLAAGTYTGTVTDQNGCEETYEAIITEPALIETNQTIDLCFGESITVGSNIYTTTAVYTDVLTAINGCDSIVTTDLTVAAELSATISPDGNSLTADQTGTAYQWLDCGNGLTPMTGQTNATFTPTENGSYAVIITQGDCSDTSACFVISDVGLTQNDQAAISVFPNPASDVVSILYSGKILLVEFTDTRGSLVKTITENPAQFSIAELPAGIYYARVITTTNEILIHKIVKQNL